MSVCVCVCVSACLSVCLLVSGGGLSVSVCMCLSVHVSVWVGGCVGVVSVKIKRPALPPCAVDGRSRNHFSFFLFSFFNYYYYCRTMQDSQTSSRLKLSKN